MVVTSSRGVKDLARSLTALSVRRRWDPYDAVPWDAPELAVDPGDPRWIPLPWDPLTGTSWYQELPPADRSAAGLRRAVALVQAGIELESLLQVGLLAYASTLPVGAPDRGYIGQEVAEEARHTLMFQEFVARTGVEVRVAARPRQVARDFARMGVENPALLFLAVLAGEEALDHVQRLVVRTPGAHPLLVHICRLHVRDEARHLSYARGVLMARAATWTRLERRALELQVPIVLERTAAMVLRLGGVSTDPPWPSSDVLDGATGSAAARALEAAAFRRVRDLCTAIGLRVGAASRGDAILSEAR